MLSTIGKTSYKTTVGLLCKPAPQSWLDACITVPGSDQKRGSSDHIHICSVQGMTAQPRETGQAVALFVVVGW